MPRWHLRGTHNPLAPPFDFIDRAFLPLVRRMGATVEAGLERAGFHPAGGGRIHVTIEPARALRRLVLLERGRVLRRSARAFLSKLPAHVARRELDEVRKRLDLTGDALRVEELRDSPGLGNALLIEVESEHVTEVFTAFGRRGTRAETVAREAIEEAREYLAADVPAGKHLADQLLIPLALAGGGSFRTLAPTLHTLTNIEVIGKFVEVDVRVAEEDRGAWRIELTAAP